MYDYICHMSEIVKLTQLWTNFVLVSWTCVRMIQNGSKWIKSNSKKPETLSLFLSFFHSFLSNFLELWLAKTPVSGRGSGIPIRGCVFLYSFSFPTQHSKAHTKKWHEHGHCSSEYDFPKMAQYNSVRRASARRNVSWPKSHLWARSSVIIPIPWFLGHFYKCFTKMCINYPNKICEAYFSLS